MTRKILWIHGWGVTSKVWRDAASCELSQNEHYFVDFDECVDSSDFYKEIESKLTEGSRNSGGSGEWILIGWSMGGMLALETIFNTKLRQRFHITSIVVVAGTLRFVDSDRSKGWPQRIIQRMQKQLVENTDETLSRFKELMLSETDKNGIDQGEFAVRIESPEVPQHLIGLQNGLTYLMETDLHDSWEKFLQEDNAVRLLWIHGNQDAICPAGCVPNTNMISELNSNYYFKMIDGAGHVPFLTEPSHFYSLLRGFLDDELK